MITFREYAEKKKDKRVKHAEDSMRSVFSGDIEDMEIVGAPLESDKFRVGVTVKGYVKNVEDIFDAEKKIKDMLRGKIGKIDGWEIDHLNFHAVRGEDVTHDKNDSHTDTEQFYVTFQVELVQT